MTDERAAAHAGHDSADAPVRVLVVDDTGIVRRVVTKVLEAAGDVEVVGTAADGAIALRKIGELAPDVVTLDIEMPVMDGLQTLRELRRRWPRLPVIMFSTLTERGARATLEALTLGANDYVTKPTGQQSADTAIEAVRDGLVPLVRYWGRLAHTRPAATAPAAASTASLGAELTSGTTSGTMSGARPGSAPAPSPDDGALSNRNLPRPRAATRRPARAVVIGSSTGGPNALVDVLTGLPSSFPVPVFVVQHMPATFTRILAERLDARCALTVTEARAGDVARPGTVHVAPGGRHMLVSRRGHDVVVDLDDSPPENFCRPAVDPLFRSAAQVWGPDLLALVLTGMGRDGLAGAQVVTDAGGSVLAQDEETSVVWGMPGFVARAGLAERVLPLPRITAELLTRAANGAPAPARQRTTSPR